MNRKIRWTALLASSILLMGGTCDQHAVAPDSSTQLAALETTQYSTNVHIGATVGPTAMFAYDVGRGSLVIDIDWSSSNPAILKLSSPSAAQTGPNGGGAKFLAISEGSADIIGTPRSSIRTYNGQPLIYRQTVSVGGVPVNVRISPAAPILLQVEDASVVNAATEVLARTAVTSASGRSIEDVSFTWLSLDPSIAAFRQLNVGGTAQKLDRLSGNPAEAMRVIGVSPGLARIVATLDNNADFSRPARYADTVLVIVGGGQVVVSQTSGLPDLEIGEKATFRAQIKDANGGPINNPSIRWSTTVSSVATVSQTGEVTAVGAGSDGDTASVLAFVPSLGVTGLQHFKVFRKVASIAVTPSPINLVAGTGGGAIARFRDVSGNAIRAYRGVATWTLVMSAGVASLGPSLVGIGLNADTVRTILPVSPGDGTLTVSYAGATSAVVPVHITATIGTVFITVPIGGGNSRPVVAAGEPLTIGNTLSLVGTSRDLVGNPVSEAVTFTTSTPNIVSITNVTANGATITGLSTGTGTVTVTSSSNSQVSAIAKFVVTATGTGGTAVRIDITSIPIDGVATVGGTVQFRGAPKDVNGLPASDCPVGWATDATNIASINASGLATAIRIGATGVRAFCTDHGTVASAAKITVKDGTFGVTQINVSPRFIYLTAGAAFTFTALIAPAAAAAAPISWELVPSSGPVTFDPLIPGRVIVPTSISTTLGGGVKIAVTAAGQSDTAWVTYGAAGSIKGTVTSASGAYLGATTATATPTGGGASVITGLNNEGIFYLVGLPVGSYTVVVRQQGNPTAQTVTNVAVTAGGTALLTLTPFP